MLSKIKMIALAIVAMLSLPLMLEAQESTGKTVTLVVSGDGPTKDEATKQALRSAIEQAFGTFVSANTDILNDDLIRDEIVTISSGNVSDYKEISCLPNKDGSYNVTLEATVSIGKLTSFAKSKGITVDLATGAFAMNMKIRELNKQNEVQAIKDLQTKLRKMSFEYNFFDYSLELSEPYIKGENYAVTANIILSPNKNLINFRNEIISTLKALSLTEEEQEEYSRANIPFTKVAVTEYDSDDELLASMQKSAVARNKTLKGSIVALRNTDPGFPLLYFPTLFLLNELKISLEDNTGEYFGIMYFPDESQGQRKSPGDIAYSHTPEWPVYNFDSDHRNGQIEYYKFVLGSTVGGATLKRSILYHMNELFDFTIIDSNDPMGNPMLSGPAKLSFEMIYPKDHFVKINDISLKYRRPYYKQ